jgi:hypothetical protein
MKKNKPFKKLLVIALMSFLFLFVIMTIVSESHEICLSIKDNCFGCCYFILKVNKSSAKNSLLFVFIITIPSIN